MGADRLAQKRELGMLEQEMRELVEMGLEQEQKALRPVVMVPVRGTLVLVQARKAPGQGRMVQVVVLLPLVLAQETVEQEPLLREWTSLPSES